jgi:hypothetical protein
MGYTHMDKRSKEKLQPLTEPAFHVNNSFQSQNSVVGIATSYGLDDRGVGVRVPVGSRPALGPTKSPIQWIPGALSPWVKRPGCEADHSPPASVEVKKIWIYTSTPPYAFMEQCLID